MKRKFVMASVALILLGWFAYTLVQINHDREGRILFALVIMDLESKMPNLEKEFLATGKLVPEHQQLNGHYGNSMDVVKKYSFTMTVSESAVEVTFPEGLVPLSGKTALFEPVIASGKIKWLCNKGTVDNRYKRPSCRSNEGMTFKEVKI